MKNFQTIVQIGVIIMFSLLFTWLINPFTETLVQSFCGGIILALFYNAITDDRKHES